MKLHHASGADQRQRVTFGLRPDDVYPVGHGLHAGDQVETRPQEVLLTEPLGNETLLFIRFGGAEWTSRMLNPRPLRRGETVDFQFDLSRAHLFDAETGKSLRDL